MELWQKTEGALRKPLVGAGIAGAIVLAAAAVWGAPEAAVGAAAAYGVYWLVRNRGKGQSERRSDTRSSGDEPRREAASAATAHPGHT